MTFQRLPTQNHRMADSAVNRTPSRSRPRGVVLVYRHWSLLRNAAQNAAPRVHGSQDNRRRAWLTDARRAYGEGDRCEELPGASNHHAGSVAHTVGRAEARMV
jgi:hypothetical protein